jgi:peptidyl-prolyl cis-trans isomerase SurA
MTRRTFAPWIALAVAFAVAVALPRPDARAQTGGGTTPPVAPAPAPPATGKAERVDGVAAVVNDEAVLSSDVDEQLYLFLQQNRAPLDSATVAEVRRKIVDKLIDEKLIVGEAKKQNVTVATADIEKNVDAAIADAKQRLGSAEAYQAELDRMGMSEADLRKRYHDEAERELLAELFLRRQIGSKTEVTPAEAETYFKEHGSEFPNRPAAMRVQLIQIPIEPDSSQRTAARRRANAALARVKKGEPFSRLAQELSDDTGTKANGGDLGWFKKGTLDSTFETAAFKLPVGTTSGLVTTPYGYHLIKVEEADKTKGEIHARHILFAVRPTQADADRTRKRVEDVRLQAVKGVDFGTLARRYSKFDGPAGPDGDLGLVPVTAFSPDFRSALDTLEIGQVSAPLLNPQGYHLFKLNDREPERAYQVEEIKEQLPELVRQARLRTSYDTFVADLRKKAHIEYR